MVHCVPKFPEELQSILHSKRENRPEDTSLCEFGLAIIKKCTMSGNS